MKPEDFRRLATAGLTTDQIALVMEIMEREAKAHDEADEARKLKARERVAKWRERHRDVTETSPKVTERLTSGDARVEDKTSNSEIEPQKKVGKEAARGTRLPSDFALPADWFQWALARGLPEPRIPVEFEKLTNWAANAPGSKAVKRDWFKAWQNWVLGAIDALPQNRAPPASKAAPSMSQLLTAIRDHPNANEPGPPEDRSSFRQAIPDLRIVGSG